MSARPYVYTDGIRAPFDDEMKAERIELIGADLSNNGIKELRIFRFVRVDMYSDAQTFC